MTDPDAPEWASYARERHDAEMHTPPPLRDERWSGYWQEMPEKGEYVERDKK